jgi:hypothetical protein
MVPKRFDQAGGRVNCVVHGCSAAGHQTVDDPVSVGIGGPDSAGKIRHADRKLLILDRELRCSFPSLKEMKNIETGKLKFY